MCEVGHKVQVIAIYSCKLVAAHRHPMICSSQSNSITAVNDWLKNPFQSKALCDITGECHRFPRT